MRNIVLIMVMAAPLLLAGQDKGKTFQLSGKMENLAYKAEWVYLEYRSNDDWKTDSVKVREGKYSFTGKVEEPVQGRLRVKYEAGKDGKNISALPARDRVSVFLQPGAIKVTSVDSFSNVQVKGSAAHAEFEKLNGATKPYREQLEKLYKQHAEYKKAKDMQGQQRTEEQVDAIDAEMREKVYGEYVRQNPSSPMAMYALQQFAGWDINPDKAEPLFNSLAGVNKNYPSATEFKENLEIAKKTAIGRMAMDFTQNDTLGNPVSLASFRGKYLLIDFWASWCGPCRAENPNVVKVFNKYKDRNFHVLGISLDRPGQQEKWLKAIHDDELAWTHVSDLQFWDNEVAKQYGIKAIPQNLLLDPAGKIIAKNIRGEELETRVAEAIESKKGF